MTTLTVSLKLLLGSKIVNINKTERKLSKIVYAIKRNRASVLLCCQRHQSRRLKLSFMLLLLSCLLASLLTF